MIKPTEKQKGNYSDDQTPKTLKTRDLNAMRTINTNQDSCG